MKGSTSSVIPRALATALLFYGPGRVPAQEQPLGVPLRPQVGAQWCWAASAEMIHDFLRDDSFEGPGQCSLAKVVLQGCNCQEPSIYFQSDECNVATPFSNPFVPQVLKPHSFKTLSTATQHALTEEALKCELVDRESPAIFWWQYGTSCHQAGHLAVAMGWHETADSSSLIAILDPLPVNSGDRYWATYFGFSCGPLGAHCTDYFGFRDRKSPHPCALSDGPLPDLSTTPDCTQGTFEQIDPALAQVETWVANEKRVKEHLQLPADAGTGLRCNSSYKLFEAVPARTVSGSLETTRTRHTRYFCLWMDDGPLRVISVQIYKTGSGYSISRFGQERYSSRLVEAAGFLDPSFLGASEDGPPGIELEEVFFPGQAISLIIARTPTEMARVLVVGDFERTWTTQDILDLMLPDAGDEDPLTLGRWIREWTAAGL